MEANDALATSPEKPASIERSSSIHTQSSIPPAAIAIPSKSEVAATVTTPHSATISSASSVLKNRKKKMATISDQVTEMPSLTEDTPIKSAIPGSFIPRNGLTSSTLFGGPFDLFLSSTKRIDDPINELLPSFLYGKWYHNSVTLYLTAIICTILAKLKAGFGVVFLVCLLIGNIKTKPSVQQAHVSMSSYVLSYKC